MSKFGPASFQATQVAKELQILEDDNGNRLFPSVGTIRNYGLALRPIAKHMDENRLGSLKDITVSQANKFLETQAQDYSQSTVDMQRQAIQAMMQHITHKLSLKAELPRVISDGPPKAGRSYSHEQSNKIIERQHESNALATEIARYSGARVHELFTLRLAHEKVADNRPISEHKFKGLDGGVRYTVTGKGGLTREIIIRQDLSDRLEARRLDTPRQIIDREIKYTQHYNISAGHRFSNSFSQASNRALGFSRGAHGLRHSYAQERMNTLQCLGLSRDDALRAVSQEMGHFRPDIVEVYLR